MSGVIWTGRRSFRSQIGLIMLIVFGFVLTLRLSPLLPQKLTVILYILFTTIGLEVCRRVYDTLYVVTKTHIIQNIGILSLTRSKFTINVEDIRDISVHQTLIGRILDFGTVSIGTAAEASNEIFFLGVKSPKSVADLIRSISIESNSKIED